jgi:hypothetical protein
VGFHMGSTSSVHMRARVVGREQTPATPINSAHSQRLHISIQYIHCRELTFTLHTQLPPTITMSSHNKDQTSTLQGYVDQASGAVQSALGSLTGSTADQVRFASHAYFTPYFQILIISPRSMARTKKTSLPPKKTSRTPPPKLVPSPSAPRAALQKTTKTALTARGTKTLAPPKRPLVVLSAQRASSRRVFDRTRRGRARRLLVR